jgi:hypothetical protein
MSQTSPDTNISDLEAAKLLLDEWKFRQQHCWSLLPRYGLAAIFVSIIPYLKIELFTNYHIDKLIFPWIGWLLALAATWLFLAEQYRCYSVLEHYRKLIGKERIHKMDAGFYRLLDRLKVRWATPAIFFIGFTILTFLNIRILKRMP